MNERDRDIVEDARSCGGRFSIRDVLSVIDCFDKQLAEIKEAWGPIEEFVEHIESSRRDDEIIDSTRLRSDPECCGEKNVKYLKIGHLRRVNETVKDE